MANAQKKAIGRRIKELREARRWTQHELASQIPDPKVDAQSVSKWERGIYQPRKHLEALAKALGVNEGDILAGDRSEAGKTPDVLGQLNGEPGARELSAAVANLRDDVAELRQDLAATRTKLLAAIAKGQQAPASQRTKPRRRARGS